MMLKIIGIILGIFAAGFLAIAALWFIGFVKICQAWAWLFKDYEHRL